MVKYRKKVWGYSTFTVGQSNTKLPGAPENAFFEPQTTGDTFLIQYRAGTEGNGLIVDLRNWPEERYSFELQQDGRNLIFYLPTDDVLNVSVTMGDLLNFVNNQPALWETFKFSNYLTSNETALDSPQVCELAGGTEASQLFLLPFTHAEISVTAGAVYFTSDRSRPSNGTFSQKNGSRIEADTKLTLADPERNYRRFLEELSFTRATVDATVRVEYFSL